MSTSLNPHFRFFLPPSYDILYLYIFVFMTYLYCIYTYLYKLYLYIFVFMTYLQTRGAAEEEGGVGKLVCCGMNTPLN